MKQPLVEISIQLDPLPLRHPMPSEEYFLIFNNEKELIAAGGPEKIEDYLSKNLKMGICFVHHADNHMPDFNGCIRLVGIYIGNYRDKDMVKEKFIKYYRSIYDGN